MKVSGVRSQESGVRIQNKKFLFKGRDKEGPLQMG
jgi:hypothetical protein